MLASIWQSIHATDRVPQLCYTLCSTVKLHITFQHSEKTGVSSWPATLIILSVSTVQSNLSCSHVSETVSGGYWDSTGVQGRNTGDRCHWNRAAAGAHQKPDRSFKRYLWYNAELLKTGGNVQSTRYYHKSYPWRKLHFETFFFPWVCCRVQLSGGQCKAIFRHSA